jgi:hypothetical protein
MVCDVMRREEIPDSKQIKTNKTMKNSKFCKWTAAGLLMSGLAVCQTASAVNFTLDLTTAGASGTVEGGVFQQVPEQPTGSGVIKSFVRISDASPQTGLVVEGYNASARPVMPDVNLSPTFTRDIRLGEVPLVTLSTGEYYQFLLDINQTGSDPWLSLDSLDIYTRSTALTSADNLADLSAAPSVPRYSLDAASNNNTILLNYSLNTGSGSGDMFAYIPKGKFSGASATDFLYLYSKFGDTVPHQNNDGYEEWAVLGAPAAVPDGGATVALMGLALGGLSLSRRFLKVPTA